jgi:hypothetical protein
MDGGRPYTATTFTYGSSMDLRLPASGSNDGFEHSTYMTSTSKHVYTLTSQCQINKTGMFTTQNGSITV